MLTRSYCCYCKGQINDSDIILKNSVTNATAHRRCVLAQPKEKVCESEKPCEKTTGN